MIQGAVAHIWGELWMSSGSRIFVGLGWLPVTNITDKDVNNVNLDLGGFLLVGLLFRMIHELLDSSD